ncbi:MAG: hypothetical protein HY569_03300 [Candidatus Magasanikbacteria bacterium]|nr:hypothetical protein [Candidatus Magasanikbacteria bacterium]
MGRKTKFPLRNLFYWSAFCVALFFLIAPPAKASLLSDVSNAKNSSPKKSAIPFSAFAKKTASFGQSIMDAGANLGKTFTNDIKDFGATVGNSMDSVGMIFESSVKDGENSIAGLFNATQKTVKEKIGKISVKTAQPVRADQKEENALKAKTIETKVSVKEQLTASFLQTGLDQIKNITKKAVDAGADFGQTLSQLVDMAQEKIGQLADKINPSADEQPTVKNIAVESGVVVGPKTEPAVSLKPSALSATEKPTQSTVQTKKTATAVASKPQLTVYSNKTEKITSTSAKASADKQNTDEDQKSSLAETKTVTDTANEITTLKDVKIIGTVDFTGATVTGLQQTVVNNYSSGPSMTVYNEKDKKNEEWTMVSGAGGGVSHGFSVGTNLSVGKSSDSTSGDITATKNITAGGNITASGSGTFGSLTMSSIAASGNSSVSGTLQVTNTTTLYNDLLVGTTAAGHLTGTNNLLVNGQSEFDGTSWFDGSLRASSTLLSTGNVTFYGDTTLGDAAGDAITINGRLGTINISDGSTTSSLSKNSFYVGDTANNGIGKFYVDSSGNVSASGTLNLPNTAVTSTIAGGLTVDTNSLVVDYSSGKIGVGTTGPMATIHVGNGTTNGSADSQILISRLVNDTISGNGHAFSDSSNVSRSGTIGYNSYDTEVTFSGSNNFNHYAGYQFAPTYASAGTISNIYGFYSLPSLSTGIITNYYGVFTADPSITATLTNNYGVYIADQTAGINDWGLYVGMSGAASSTPIEVKQTGAGTVTQILLNRDTANAGDLNLIKWKSSTLEGASIGMAVKSSSLADLVFSTNSTAATTTLTEKMRITGAGNVGIGVASPAEKLTLSGGNFAIVNSSVTSTLGSNFFSIASSTSNMSGLFYVDSSGNVSATGSLKTFGNVTSTGNLYALTGTASTSILNGSSLSLGQGTAYNSGMFNVDSNGNVSASGTIMTFAGSSGVPGLYIGATSRGIATDASYMYFIIGGSNAAKLGSNSNFSTNFVSALGAVSEGIQGGIADGATAIAVKIGNQNALSTAGAKIASFYSDGFSTEKAYVDVNGGIGLVATAGTFANGKFNVDSSGNVSASGSLKTFGNVTSTGNLYALSGTASTSILNGSSLSLGQGTAYNSGMFNVDSNGNVSASGTFVGAGSVSLPTHSFIGDSDTGFYPYSANVIGISSAGAVVGTIGTGSEVDFNTLKAFNSQSLTISGREAEDGTAIAIILDNTVTLTNAAEKLVSIRNNTSEKAFFGINGEIASNVATNYNLGKFYVDSSGNVSATGSLKTFGNVTSTGNLYALTGTASTSILNGSSLSLGQGTSYNSGMFNVDSNGNVSASGTILTTAGSAALPSFGFVSDPNTGVYDGAADTLSFTTGGTNRMSMSGTAASFAVPIWSTSGTSLVLGGRATEGATAIGIKFNQVDGLGTVGSKLASFYSDNGATERAFIGYDGSMGLVVSSTTGYAGGKFAVDSSGNISTSGTLAFTASAGVAVSSTAGNLNLEAKNSALSAMLKLYSNGTEMMRMGTGGGGSANGILFGVATNFNNGVLSINQQNGDISTSGTLAFTASAGGAVSSTVGNLNISAGAPAGGKLMKFWVDGTEVVRLGSNPSASGLFIGVDAINNAGVFNVNNQTGNIATSGTIIQAPLATNITGNGVCITSGNQLTNAGAAACNPSALKFKTDVQDLNLDTATNIIMALKPITFTDKAPVSENDKHFGFIADWSKDIDRRLVDLKDGEPWSFEYMNYTAVLTKVIQEQQRRLAELEQLTINENNDGTLSINSSLTSKTISGILAINTPDNPWYIDETGLMVAKDIKADSVQAKKFVVKKKSDAKQTSVGEATILNNSTLILVQNELVTSTSKIFITFRSNPNAFWWISKQEDGKFEVSLSKLSETDLTFDYWIISTENADEEDTTQTIDETNNTQSELSPEQSAEPITEETQSPAPIEEPAVEDTTQTTDEVAPQSEQPAEPTPTVESTPMESAPITAETAL